MFLWQQLSHQNSKNTRNNNNNNNDSNNSNNLAFGMCTFIKAKRRFINFVAWLVLCGKLVF